MSSYYTGTGYDILFCIYVVTKLGPVARTWAKLGPILLLLDLHMKTGVNKYPLLGIWAFQPFHLHHGGSKSMTGLDENGTMD